MNARDMNIIRMIRNVHESKLNFSLLQSFTFVANSTDLFPHQLDDRTRELRWNPKTSQLSLWSPPNEIR